LPEVRIKLEIFSKVLQFLMMRIKLLQRNSNSYFLDLINSRKISKNLVLHFYKREKET